MKSKSKSLLSMTVAVLFTLSVCYFAMLSPTSAWYYSADELENSFVFGDLDLDLDLPEEYIDYSWLTMRGATAFADSGEVLFDDAVAVATIEAQNAGNVPARVYVTYTSQDTNTGMHYFFVGEEVGGEEVSFKEEIEKVLVDGGLELIDYSQQLPSSVTDYTTDSDAILDDYLENGYVVVEPNTTETIKIAVWIEGSEGEILTDAENNLYASTYASFMATFRLSATQDTDGAFNVETRQIIVNP